MALDGVGDVAEMIARPGLLEPEHQAFVGDVDQLPGAKRDVADQIHPAGIAVPTVEDRGDVDVDDVPVLQDLVARNAVANDVVDRGAATLGVSAITESCRHSTRVERHPLDDRVNLSGCDAGNHLRHQRVEYFGGEAAGAAHALEPLGPVQLDHMAARFRPVFGAYFDIFGHGLKIG